MTTNRSQQARQIFNNVVTNSRSTGSPLPKLLLGIVLLIFFVGGSLLHVQTSEAFFSGGNPVSILPDFGILSQPFQLFGIGEKLTPRMAGAVMWGWGIELTFLICVVGYEVAHDAVAASSQKMASFFRTGAIALVIFDGYADFNYGNIASGPWGQLGFTLMTGFAVCFFGTIGLRFIESGLADWNR
jgi:hypothetical protein